MINLSVIIVTYNSGNILNKCLLSLERSEFQEFEVIVVDNASRDNPKKITDKFKRVQFIQNLENFGFSKANNIGIKKSKGKYVLFLNPDVELNSDTLEIMFNFMEKNKNAGTSTCKVLLPNGNLDDSSHRGFPTPWNAFSYFSGIEKIFPTSRIFAGYHMGWEDLRKIHEIDAAAGSFMFVRRNAGEDIGWWDEDYFFYGEDLDFCFKLKEKGWKTFFVPKAKAVHYKGTSSGIKKVSKEISTADLETKKFATMHRFKAMEIFYKKHYKKSYPNFLTRLVLLGIKIKYWFALRSLN